MGVMITESQYKECVKYAKYISINDKSVNPIDLVQDAFLKLHESDFNLKEYQKIIKSLFYESCKIESRGIPNTRVYKYHGRANSKEDNYKNFVAYLKRNRLLWNSYMRKRDREDCHRLTDSYIIKAIRNTGKYSTLYIKDHPELIEQARERIRLKRQRSASKRAIKHNAK